MKRRIGIFQYKFRNEKPQERIKRLEEKIKRIKIKADIIVCPELFLSGYGNNKDIKMVFLQNLSADCLRNIIHLLYMVILSYVKIKSIIQHNVLTVRENF